MKTILLIEDNNEIRENTSEILRLENYKVITASNGQMGVEMAIRENPDLILCDIMMPVLDGFGVLTALNAWPYTKNNPFIFLTCKSELNEKIEGLRMGADDYLTKPFDVEFLLTTIALRINKYEANREKIEAERNEYLKSIRKMQELTSHGVRKPVANCLGLMQLLDPDNKVTLCREELEKIFDSLKPCILELEEYIKELTLFMHSEQNKNNKYE